MRLGRMRFCYLFRNLIYDWFSYCNTGFGIAHLQFLVLPFWFAACCRGRNSQKPTPLVGCGARLVPRMLKDCEFKIHQGLESKIPARRGALGGLCHFMHFLSVTLLHISRCGRLYRRPASRNLWRCTTRTCLGMLAGCPPTCEGRWIAGGMR